MTILPIYDLKEGMILAEAVYSNTTKKLLLSEGNRLTKNSIKIFKENKVTSAKISDPDSLFITPTEMMANTLEKLFQDKIQTICPPSPQANLSDEMIDVSKKSLSILTKVLNDDEVLTFCVVMNLTGDKLFFQHAINTCVLSSLIASALKLEDQLIYDISVAALLHDIGLCEMPFLINVEHMNQQEDLLWKEHPRYGFYITKEHNLSPQISEFILSHHECFDGSGFPMKLTKDRISIGARIINICDQYDDLITCKQLQPHEAIEYLYCGGGILFDQNIITTFVNSIPVYPLGSLVRLTTGEVGVVINIRKNLGPRPIIRVFYNASDRPLTKSKTIDLGEEKTIFIKEVLN